MTLTFELELDTVKPIQRTKYSLKVIRSKFNVRTHPPDLLSYLFH